MEVVAYLFLFIILFAFLIFYALWQVSIDVQLKNKVHLVVIDDIDKELIKIDMQPRINPIPDDTNNLIKTYHLKLRQLSETRNNAVNIFKYDFLQHLLNCLRQVTNVHAFEIATQTDSDEKSILSPSSSSSSSISVATQTDESSLCSSVFFRASEKNPSETPLLDSTEPDEDEYAPARVVTFRNEG